jgi:hypothetical protein
VSLTIKGDPNERRSKLPDMGDDVLLKPPALVRRATKAERERAQFLLDQFEVDGDLQVIFDALRRFARDGTFADTTDMRPQMARNMARRMKCTYEVKVAELAEYFNVPDATCANWLRKSLSKRDAE